MWLVTLLAACASKAPPASPLQPAAPAPAPLTVRVTTYNVAALPYVFGIATNPAPRGLKARRLAGLVADTDLLLAQEAWSPRFRERLGRRLAATDSAWPDWDRSVWGGTGLAAYCLAEDCTFTGDRTTPFASDRRGFDAFAAKGVQLATVQVDGAALVVANTHLHSEGADEIRMIQAAELVDTLAPFSDLPVVLGGDFNTARKPRDRRADRESEEEARFREIMEGAGFVDLCCPEGGACERTHNISKARYDRLYARAPQGWTLEVQSCEVLHQGGDGWTRSDHRPVAAQVRFTPP